MTQTKTLARLFKSAASTSLALSALAGGVMLSGGEAKAVTTVCDPPSGQLTAICTTSGDAYVGVTFSNTASGGLTTSLPNGTTAFINLEGTGLAYPFSQQQIDTDFNGPLTGGQQTSVYTIITDAKTPFDQVDLSWVNIPGGNSNVSAKYDFFLDDAPLGSATLNTNGSVFGIVGTLPNKIVVTNTYTPGNGAIDNAQNTFRNVPGPLPILGAGAAFGFSRKLRGRIKGARTA